jgi:hypothetical protein
MQVMTSARISRGNSLNSCPKLLIELKLPNGGHNKAEGKFAELRIAYGMGEANRVASIEGSASKVASIRDSEG